tara:strand:- start:83 stop:289 length:207 start_codon:yes stop_codon:yes gene_type:complete
MERKEERQARNPRNIISRVLKRWSGEMDGLQRKCDWNDQCRLRQREKKSEICLEELASMWPKRYMGAM